MQYLDSSGSSVKVSFLYFLALDLEGACKLKKSLSLARHYKRKILQWQTRVSNQTEICQRGFGELVRSIPIWRFQCSLSNSWENHWTCWKRTKVLKRTTREHYVRFRKTFHKLECWNLPLMCNNVKLTIVLE